jgi:hypothetical protein
MYQFAIDMGERNSYTPGSASGCEVSKKLFDNTKSEAGSGCHVLTAGFGKWVIW